MHDVWYDGIENGGITLKLSYKNALKVYTLLFLAGVLVLALAALFGAVLPVFPLQLAGALTIAAGVGVCIIFWRCPHCKRMLPKSLTIPPDCPNCNQKLA